MERPQRDWNDATDEDETARPDGTKQQIRAWLARNAGNLDLGLNLTHWLSHDETLIDIHVKSAPDTSLVLGNVSKAVIGLGFLFGLPALLLISGLVIWIRRRRR